MGGQRVDTCTEFFKTVVGKSDSAFFRKGSEDLPLFSGVTGGFDYFETHLNASFGVDWIGGVVP